MNVGYIWACLLNQQMRPMTYFRLIALTLLIIFIENMTVKGRGNKTGERTLYVLDSVALETGSQKHAYLEKKVLWVDNIAIFSKDTVTDSVEIARLGFKNTDTIIYIITREYHDRPQDIKKIPTGFALDMKRDRYYLKGSKTPYSGPIIEYFLLGKKRMQFKVRDGYTNDTMFYFFPDGKTVETSIVFKDGIRNGRVQGYFSDGKIKETGEFLNGKHTGIWTEYYSTGKLKSRMLYTEGIKTLLPQDKPTWDYYYIGKSHKIENEFDDAIKSFTKAIALKPDFAEAYYERSRMLAARSKLTESLKDLNQAIAIEPYYIEAIATRAIVRAKILEAGNGPTDPKEAEKEKDNLCADLKIVNIQFDTEFDMPSPVFAKGITREMIENGIAKYCR